MSYSELEGCGSIMGWWIKGHVDKQQFRDEVEAEWGYDYPPDDVQHDYARCIPGGPAFDNVTLLHFYQKPGRGAFMVTHLENTHSKTTGRLEET